MKKMNLKFLMATLFSLFFMTASYGQGWEQDYYIDTMSSALDQTMDNGYIILMNNPNHSGMRNSQLIKTDVNGDTLWTKKVDIPANNYCDLKNIGQTADGGYILGGENRVLGNIAFYLVKTDANGDTLWTKNYRGLGRAFFASVQQTTDGGYIVVGTTTAVGVSNLDIYLIKTDANGTVLWTQMYGGTNDDEGADVQQTTDGGYIVIGSSDDVNSRDAYVIKTDASGNASWTQRYGAVGTDEDGFKIQQTPDGGYILGSSLVDTVVLTKIDGLGVMQWTQSYGVLYQETIVDLLQFNGTGYSLVGTIYTGENYILRVDNSGALMWNSLNNNIFVCYKDAVAVGNGYALLGNRRYDWTPANVPQSVFLWRLDSLGNTVTNNIKGNIFNDTSFDCLKDSGERNFEGIVVTAVGSNRTWYGTTDSLGSYCILVDTGAYVVSIDEPVYWQACANNISVTFTNLYTNDTIDFPLQAQMNCPLMQVDLSAPFIRTNSTGSNYTVNYCNNGTVDAINASVEVTIDADLDILNTSLPIASQVGNTLTFNIGNVNYGDCGSFTIQVRANTTAILGQTHCSQAHIFPDSLCLPAWTGGVIDPNVTCQNDSVTFELENIGTGLFNSETYYVFEDHVIMRTGNTGNISSGGSFNLTMAADTGKTYRMSVPQNVGYPALLGDSIASVAIEGCVPYLTGAFNTGFITQFPNGNSAPSIAVDCQANRGSYDPNDKAAQPKGYDAQHYIYSYTDLDYKIRFQNTGTDTAFLVVIRDTISPLLDLSTLTMGASSHNYTWRVYGERVLEITYENILLPDSTTNEPASNGFVRYRIEQTAGNVVGDVIYNGADIYFDFNAPIQTNQTFHTIGENFVTIMLDQTTILDEAIDVKVYPNPFTQNASLEVQGKDYKELQLTIYDVSGRMVLEKQAYSNNTIELSRGNLQPGIYFYQLLGDAALINTGKLIVQ
ncbi:MAG: FIG01179438: hypothetical protein [uncultured Aureispira sp.]|uniref:Uncharacterized protein n=1 Tax=uncultured Aureispira sp. TaxID=1331704 RepID=A0A6S6TA66_9BACT|nr:MAG: FIG01179438: hypothetical protein [uncultured Aureispira sp.]